MQRRHPKRRQAIRRRRPFLESLEQRRLLASDWTDGFNPRDVNGDWLVAPVDALIVINKINRDGSGMLPLPRPDGSPSYDTNGDGLLAPVDVLTVVDTINNDQAGPQVTAGLLNDTAAGGATNDDRLTSDARIAGQVIDSTGIRSLRGSWNNQTIDVVFTRGGDFTFTPPAATDGSDDGQQIIQLVATDARGNTTTHNVPLTLDTTPPLPSSLGLTASTDTGTDDTDGITNNTAPTAKVTLEPNGIITLLLDGNPIGSETTSGSSLFPLPTLLEGDHALQVIAEDAAGNVSPPSPATTIRVDLTPPTAMLDVAAPIRSATDTLNLAFSEAVSSAAAAVGSYALQQLGAGALPLLQATPRPQNSVQLALNNTLDDGSYQLQLTNLPTDLAGNPLAGNTQFAFDVARQTSISRLSPAAGEELVNVTRETIVRFDNPIDPATVSADAFYLVANGERISGRRVVSSTERFMTFFYDAPLPAATEVRVVVDGNLIQGRDGKLLDADGDGQPGGVATADFRTLPLTRIAGTHVFGFVRDSYTGQPIVGATIRVDAFPEANAVTDEYGRFELRDMPAPEFFVHVDGSTATGAPAGFTYPNVGKPFHSVPGQTVQLEMDGQAFDVFLPPMALADVQDLSPTQVTAVGFGAAGKAELEQMFPDVDPAVFDRMQVMIAPGAAVDDVGNAATQATIIPVPPDRIPAPLPPNLNPALVVSIQAPGATNFDVPASVSFPNLEGLAPGEKALLMSFDHDAGEWVVNGTATVSDDGLSIVSDPGSGIVAPGWHILDFLNSLLPEPRGPKAGVWNNIIAGILGVEGAGLDYFQFGINRYEAAFGPLEGMNKIGSRFIGGFDLFVGIGSAIGDNEIDAFELASIALDATSLVAGVAMRFTPTGLAIQAGLTLGSLALDLYNTSNSFSNAATAVFGEPPCPDATPHSVPPRPPSELFDSTANAYAQLGQQFENAGTAENLIATRYSSGANTLLGRGLEVRFGTQRDSLSFEFGAGGALIVRDLQTGQLALDPVTGNPYVVSMSDILTPNVLLEVDVQRGISNLDRDAALDASFSSIEAFRLATANGSLESLSREADRLAAESLRQTTMPLVGSTMVAIEDVHGNIVYRGSLRIGSPVPVLLRPNARFQMSLFNLASGESGLMELVSGSAGRTLALTPILFASEQWLDGDDDGLSDVAESAAGTDPLASDSDNDGIDDLAELQQGLNPLDNRGFPTGIIASLPLRGEANEVVLHGSTLDAQRQLAYVATGSHGLAIVDTSRFDNPIVLGQLDLPGDATDVAIDADRQRAVLAAGSGGLHVVDVSDPMQPVLVETLVTQASHVEVFDGLAYVASASQLLAYDLATGELLESLSMGNNAITGMAREGNLLLVMNSGKTLQAIELGASGMALRDAVTMQHGGGRVFVGGGVAYVPAASYFRGGFATVDVTNRDNLVVISESDVVSPFIGPATHVVPNGSGLGLLIGQPGSQGVVDVLDLSDLSSTNQFVTRFNLPAAPRSAALGSGLAFLADGTAGLQVVNFVPFDNLRLSPTVAINTNALDLDPNTAGIQVQEGTTVAILSAIQDDVQVRNVQLLVNGQVVANDVSFPFDFSTVVPNLAAQGDTVDLQLRATDTGGNTATSDALTLNIVPDTFAPGVIQIVPGENGRRFAGHRSVRIRFSEPMDPASLTAANLQLVALSNATTPIMPQEIQLRRDGHEVQLIYSELPVDDYQLTIQTALVTDRAGNAIGGSHVVSTFAILEDRDPGDTLPTALDLGLLDAVFTLSDRIGEDELGEPDPVDIIRFHIDRPREVRIDLTDRVDGSQIRLIADLNDDGLIDSGEALRDTGTPGAGNLAIVQNLEAGDYYLEIRRWYSDDVTPYTLTVTPGAIIVPTTPQDPGSTLGTALNIGPLTSSAVTYQDMYGVRDTHDVYKFSIDAFRQVQIDLTGRLEGGYVRLIADLDGDGQIDGGEAIRETGTPGAGDFNIVQNLEPGEYFVQVSYYYFGHITPYTITVTPGAIIVPTTPQDPGGTLGTALNIGPLTSSAVTYQDMYGVRDTHDVYKFSIDAFRQVQVDLSGRLEGGYVRLIADLNGNGQIDGGEAIRETGTPGAGDFNIVQNLEPGEYFVQVSYYYFGHITPYTITVTPGAIIVPTTPQDPGSTLGTALNMGPLTSSAVTYQDMYGVRDTLDVYKFSIDAPRQVQVDLTGRLEGGYVRLIADLNGNGQLDGGEAIRETGTPGAGDFSIVQNLEPGEYFVQVSYYYFGHITPYTITVTPGAIIVPTTPQDPGSTLGTALNIGPLTSSAVTYQDMYGVRDTHDVYKFSIDAPRQVQVDLTGRLEGGYMRLIADLNGNGQLDGGEAIRETGTPGAGDFSIVQNLEPGEYFVQVSYYYFGHITPYTLTVTPG